jgi:hypothetical protein
MRSSVSSHSNEALKGLKTPENKGLLDTHPKVGLRLLVTSLHQRRYG